MTLIKTSLLSLIATMVSMLSGLVINKCTALYIGPSGLAVVGQLQNFIQLTLTLAQGAINTGVTKYVAEYGSEQKSFVPIFSTAFRVMLVCSLLVGVTVVICANYFSLFFLKSNRYEYIFYIFGVSIVFFAINSLLLAILNGLKEIKTYISINIIQSIYSLVFTSLLIVYLGLKGALIALVMNQAVIFIIVIWMLRKHEVIRLASFRSNFNVEEMRKLFKYAVLGVTSAILYPSYSVLVRELVVHFEGLNSAGVWQGMFYISTTLSSVVCIVLSTYYLPKISELKEKHLIFNEVIRMLFLIMPILLLILVVIYLFRDLIISLLFTDSFHEMRSLFCYQLLGDFFKVLAFLLTSILVAKAKIRIAVYSEFFFYSCASILAFLMIGEYGLIATSYVYAISYFCYFLFGIVIFRRVLNEM